MWKVPDHGPPPLPDWVEKMMPGQGASTSHVSPEIAVVSPDTHPTLTPVVSSNIAGVGHDGQALLVKFQNGTVYRYPTAGADHHAGMVTAESAGQYFHQRIKSAHKGERVS
jgi:hypothetical protein